MGPMLLRNIAHDGSFKAFSFVIIRTLKSKKIHPNLQAEVSLSLGFQPGLKNVSYSKLNQNLRVKIEPRSSRSTGSSVLIHLSLVAIRNFAVQCENFGFCWLMSHDHGEDHDDLVHAHMKKGHLAGLPRSPIVLTGQRCHRLHESMHYITLQCNIIQCSRVR